MRVFIDLPEESHFVVCVYLRPVSRTPITLASSDPVGKGLVPRRSPNREE